MVLAYPSYGAGLVAVARCIVENVLKYVGGPGFILQPSHHVKMDVWGSLSRECGGLICSSTDFHSRFIHNRLSQTWMLEIASVFQWGTLFPILQRVYATKAHVVLQIIDPAKHSISMNVSMGL